VTDLKEIRVENIFKSQNQNYEEISDNINKKIIRLICSKESNDISKYKIKKV